MTAHKHAALIAQYAQDAAETNAPWDRWEYKTATSRWIVPNGDIIFGENFEFRRRTKMILVGEAKVPEPLRTAPEVGTILYVPCIHIVLPNGEAHGWFEWKDSAHDQQILKRGLCHLTKEAAAAHCHALLNFTQVE